MTELQNRDFADHGVDIVASLNAAAAVAPAPSRFTHPFDLSEDELARQFTEHHSATLKFCNSSRRWFQWSGSRWEKMPQDNAIHLARCFIRAAGGGLPKLNKAAVITSVAKLAQSDPAHAANAESWDADHYLLGTPDGVVNLRTGELRPAATGDFITKQTAVSPTQGVPSVWLKTLGELTGESPEMVRYLQQICGYALTGDTREQALFFIYGPGGNGKSVFLNTVASLFGDYSRTASMDTFSASKTDRHPTELAALQGARLVTASETEEGRAFAESRIKQLTGGDRIAARFMRQDLFEYTPQFTLIIVGNHAPNLVNVDDAMRRRMHMIPFLFKPATPDRDLERKLRDEWPQILQWMIEGCRDWQANGIVRPQIVQHATTEYFSREDTFGQWLADNCEFAPETYATPLTLYRDWQLFSSDHGEQPGTLKKFVSAMSQRGLSSIKSNGIRRLNGIKLRPTRSNSS